MRLEMLEEAVEVIRHAVAGRPAEPPRPHYTVENARVYDLPGRAAAGPRLRLRPEGDRARGADRRRLRARPRPTRTRSSSTAPRAARARSTPARRSASWPRRGGGARDRAPAVAQRGAAGRAGAGAADARRTSSRPASWSRPTRSSARPCGPGPRRARRRRCASTPTPASTSSSSSRSAPSRTRSSRVGAGDPAAVLEPNRSIPSATVVPVLIYPDVREAVAWLSAAFGFARAGEDRRGPSRADAASATGAVIIGDVRHDRVPPRAGESTHSVMVRVDDANAHFARARAHGARILMEPTDFEYGERQYTRRGSRRPPVDVLGDARRHGSGEMGRRDGKLIRSCRAIRPAKAVPAFVVVAISTSRVSPHTAPGREHQWQLEP